MNMESELKTKKRIRRCMRCKTQMLDKNRCDKCGIKFHDGVFVSWVKRMVGVSPK